MLENFRKQHEENYHRAILEIIKNNTTILVDEDIVSLLKKPPLDSMDSIKSKFLGLAKKYRVVLNTQQLDDVIFHYRDDVICSCPKILDLRIDELSFQVEKLINEKKLEIIRLNKKDFSVVNKKIKKIMKEQIKKSLSEQLIVQIDSVFNGDIDEEKKNHFCAEMVKFLNGAYFRQLLESIEIKILVKDTTLINGIKEQGERYLFTISNSRIFKEN